MIIKKFLFYFCLFLLIFIHNSYSSSEDKKEYKSKITGVLKMINSKRFSDYVNKPLDEILKNGEIFLNDIKNNYTIGQIIYRYFVFNSYVFLEKKMMSKKFPCYSNKEYIKNENEIYKYENGCVYVDFITEYLKKKNLIELFSKFSGEEYFSEICNNNFIKIFKKLMRLRLSEDVFKVKILEKLCKHDDKNQKLSKNDENITNLVKMLKIDDLLGILKENEEEFLNCFYLTNGCFKKYGVEIWAYEHTQTKDIFCESFLLQIYKDKVVRLFDQGFLSFLFVIFIRFINGFLGGFFFKYIVSAIICKFLQEKLDSDIPIKIMGLWILIFFLLDFFIDRGSRPLYILLSRKLHYIKEYVQALKNLYLLLKDDPYFGDKIDDLKKVFGEKNNLNKEQKELLSLIENVKDNWSYFDWVTNSTIKIGRLFYLFHKHKDMFKMCVISACNIDAELALFNLKKALNFKKYFCIPEIDNESKVPFIEIKKGWSLSVGFDECVKNDIKVGGDNNNIFALLGMNAGGKTVCLGMILDCLLMYKCFGFCPAEKVRMSKFDDFFVLKNDNDGDVSEGLSRFKKELVKFKEILDFVKKNDGFYVIIADEPFSSTDESGGGRILLKIFEDISINKKVLMCCSTHNYSILDFNKKGKNLKLGIYHMGINKENNKIIFTYKVNSGPPKYSISDDLFEQVFGESVA